MMLAQPVAAATRRVVLKWFDSMRRRNTLSEVHLYAVRPALLVVDIIVNRSSFNIGRQTASLLAYCTVLLCCLRSLPLESFPFRFIINDDSRVSTNPGN